MPQAGGSAAWGIKMSWVVCGGRYYNDRDKVFATLDELSRERGKPSNIISGNCSGADRLAEDWAQSRFRPSDDKNAINHRMIAPFYSK